MDRIKWEGWDAVRCSHADLELIVGVSAGPRLLSLRRNGGRNLLYLDTSDFRVGEWRLFGGHRFTVAPEGPRSYLPDNAPCAVRRLEDALIVTAARDDSGLRRLLVITPAGDGSGFDLSHHLENQSLEPWTGALWAITCVPGSGTMIAPRGPTDIRFWPGTHEGHWNVGSASISVSTRGQRGKAGWYSNPAWLAALQPDATLVIHAPESPERAACIDGGCNLEVFTGPDYLELETLGGQVTLPPGSSTRHLQRWRVLDPIYTGNDWAALATDAGCFKTATALPLSYAD